jgi:hypothetical protein
MTLKASVAPRNSVLLIMVKGTNDIPESMGGKLVVATGSCVAVGTLSEADGETFIILTNEEPPAREISGLARVFKDVLATPTKVVEVRTILLKAVLALPVPNSQTSVEIWTNSNTEPDKILISLK